MEPVISQPMGFKPMVTPYTPALDRLGPLSEIVIRQHMPKCCELGGCWEYNNQFSVSDMSKNKLFGAKEKSDCMMRFCCANLRPFSMSVYSAEDERQEVLTFERPLNCMGWCCKGCYPSCMQELTVYSGPTYLGKIIEYPTWWIKKLEVFNGNEEKVFDIKGPCCIVTCGCNNLFVVKKGESIVGNIEQFSRGICTDAFTDTNSFHIQIPRETDIREKALLIGATILMDMMFFERNNNQ